MTRTNPLPTGEEKVHAVRRMFDAIAPRYDLVNRVMTFGMDVGWRRHTVAALRLPAGSVVLDVACGTGDLCREAHAQGLRPVGLDSSAGMLLAARTSAPLVQADALALPVRDGSVDGITSGFALRNVADLKTMFDEFARTLRPGGRVAVLEVSEPRSRALRAGHNLYFRRVVPLIGAALSDRHAYAYLPRSTAYLPDPQELMRMVVRAGFEDVRRRALAFGAAQLIVGTRT
jgi:demethylmenaquinone methyltransferase / 2-methoxy-6-polyprenyl-1,4-benzoquinol methylase